jgi:hypothetical protein
MQSTEPGFMLIGKGLKILQELKIACPHSSVKSSLTLHCTAIQACDTYTSLISTSLHIQVRYHNQQSKICMATVHRNLICSCQNSSINHYTFSAQLTDIILSFENL